MKINILFFVMLLFATQIAKAEAVEAEVQVTMLLIQQNQMPAARVQYSVECEAAKSDSLFFEDKIKNKLSCVTDDNGICKFSYKTYKLDSGVYRPCIGRTGSAKIGSQSAHPDTFGFRWNKNDEKIFLTVLQKADKWDWTSPDLLKSFAGPDGQTIFWNQVYYPTEEGFRASLTSYDPLDYYLKRTIVKNDDLEAIAEINTARANDSSRDRVFIRAFFHKKTGLIKYQIYVQTEYYDNSFRNYNLAKYFEKGEPVSSEVSKISQNVDCSFKISGQCRFSESVGFSISEQVFSSNADLYSIEKSGRWRIRISSHSGIDLNASVPLAEFGAVASKTKELIKSLKN